MMHLLAEFGFMLVFFFVVFMGIASIYDAFTQDNEYHGHDDL